VKIYTGTGDGGTTARFYGGRVSKADLQVEVSGTIDETVAALGLARALTEDHAMDLLVLRIQREMFVVGADLAAGEGKRDRLEPRVSLVTADMVEGLEDAIDDTVREHPLPQEFIVPGANPVSAALDVARTAARRAERRAVQMAGDVTDINSQALRYLNRVSDLLFVLARAASDGAEPPSRGSA
jgi:cob(I)alamin adenosyltransferase